MTKFNWFFIGITAITLTSCAVGQKIQYNKVVANIEAIGTKSVSIAALDHRALVLKEGRPNDYVGNLRSGFGIPYPIGTKSKQPFSDDVASSISESLSQKGFKCSVITTTPTDETSVVAGKLKSNGSDISILFLIDLYCTDTYMASLLEYDITVSVTDKSGVVLASKRFTENKKAIGSNVLGTEFKWKIPNGFKAELEKFFNDPDIKKALQ